MRDLRMLLREIAGRPPQPRAAILDGRTLQSSPESDARAGYDGHERRKGSKVHLAVDTLGQLLAAVVTPTNEQERAQVDELAAQIQTATGDSVEVAFVDQGYTGNQPAAEAEQHGIHLEVVKLPPPSAVLCCCLGGGSSSATLPGWLVFDAWHATTNVWLKRSSGCISLPLPC